MRLEIINEASYNHIEKTSYSFLGYI